MTDPMESKTRQQFWDERHTGHEPIESRDPDDTLLEVATGLRPGRALDLGAGDGRNATWLAASGWEVTGVDFSGVAIERARARATTSGQDVTWLQRDLLAWTPPAAAFDLVTLMFIHVSAAERDGIYAGAAAAVAPGGTLLVVGHDRSNLDHGTGGPQDPEVLFTASEIAAALPADFTVVRADVVRRGGGAGPVPIDAVVVARRAAAG